MKKWLLIGFLAVAGMGYAKEQTVEVPREYYYHLSDLCKKHGLDIYFVARLIEWESDWNPKAVYKNRDESGDILSRDVGIMQLNDKYHDWYADKFNRGKKFDPYNWKENMSIGVAYLAWLYGQTGSMKHAVKAWNMGLTGFREYKAGRRNLPKPTEKLHNFVFNS